MDNEKIIQVKKLFHDYEAKSIQAVCSCDYDELAQEIVKLFAIPDVVWQGEQAGVCMHSLDMTGKCFKCGEQYIRKEG